MKQTLFRSLFRKIALGAVFIGNIELLSAGPWVQNPNYSHHIYGKIGNFGNTAWETLKGFGNKACSTVSDIDRGVLLGLGGLALGSAFTYLYTSWKMNKKIQQKEEKSSQLEQTFKATIINKETEIEQLKTYYTQYEEGQRNNLRSYVARLKSDYDAQIQKLTCMNSTLNNTCEQRMTAHNRLEEQLKKAQTELQKLNAARTKETRELPRQPDEPLSGTYKMVCRPKTPSTSASSSSSSSSSSASSSLSKALHVASNTASSAISAATPAMAQWLAYVTTSLAATASKVGDALQDPFGTNKEIRANSGYGTELTPEEAYGTRTDESD